MVCPIWG
ncbi:uncharacterized protein FFFS_16008 [Fusarium fujikuroi]|nr:uncharacterized protein FFFS_16008 [Fusarium fujikuroi]